MRPVGQTAKPADCSILRRFSWKAVTLGLEPIDLQRDSEREKKASHSGIELRLNTGECGPIWPKTTALGARDSKKEKNS